MATRKITTSLFALALAAGLSIPAHTEAQQAALPAPSIIGFGAVKGGCGKWLAVPENSAVDTAYVSWLLGDLSGVNTLAVLAGRPDFLGGYDGWSLVPWAKNWCRAHPLDPVSSAAAALVGELGKREQGNS